MCYLNGSDMLPPRNYIHIYIYIDVPFRSRGKMGISHRFGFQGHNSWGHTHDNEPSILSLDVDDLQTTSSLSVETVQSVPNTWFPACSLTSGQCWPPIQDPPSIHVEMFQMGKSLEIFDMSRYLPSLSRHLGGSSSSFHSGHDPQRFSRGLASITGAWTVRCDGMAGLAILERLCDPTLSLS